MNERQTNNPSPDEDHSHKSRVDQGQATAEYALVILAAALIAVALMTWATGGGGISNLFEAVLNRVIGLVGG
jgi:hypothetical protein